ncbi:peptide chain release factor N(5)-glutamine methyltransferase [Chlorobaculum thiosulfatiphilum]|uniref:Release factor glutamine methyltransferase n=1 Tax=Chlorobaculum thiosulfatiphilum TaxID=115852 RepID=A0A5C4S6N0_CHLTI|nr:peptide chain release factor N(5)-glutamine methyltransferase [Chlorobaculum thiosulfatiphilum]TNJ38371.1 peptide chain release factor N(5)-glutamine methyltransferase [Chlorobaculum thiosulfatiphilum]
MPEEKVWSVVELLKTTTAFFIDKKIDEPRLSAELLLGRVLGLQRLQLYLDHERPVTPSELVAFRAACRERMQGRPVQYIAGEAFFYGYRFFVDERVLIPRPETELVLEHAMERLAASGLASAQSPSILDIGTGSGSIAITLALRLPGARLTAADVSAAALNVARCNADAHGVSERITFVEADALDSSFAEKVGGSFDLVISNPPYIPEAEWATLQEEVKRYEPKLALVAPVGFEYYERIVAAAPALLGKGGVLCFELHADGAAGVRALLGSGFGGIEVMQDYNKLDRALSCISA